MTDQTQPIEPRLTSKEAADYLAGLGFKTAPATLNKYVSVGGGPPYEKFGRARKYTPSGLLAWVASKTSPPQRHTSERQQAAA
jgi:hypothetical protein